MKQIQLPDYLPSKYNNWLEFYCWIVNEMQKNGYKIDDHTELNLFEMGYDIKDFDKEQVAFYQKWPLHLLKARAFDYIMTTIPSKHTMILLRNAVGASGHRDRELIEACHNLIGITHSIEKYS